MKWFLVIVLFFLILLVGYSVWWFSRLGDGSDRETQRIFGCDISRTTPDKQYNLTNQSISTTTKLVFFMLILLLATIQLIINTLIA